MVPLKLALYLSLFMIMPFVFYQIWQFISPGLYPNERKSTAPVIIASISLFYIGALFAYYIACPLALGFFVGIAPSGVAIMTDLQSYLDFVLSMLFAFGLGFQVPIISFSLIRIGILSVDQMREQRPYIIIGAFVLGMVLTPPDVISQIMLALPLWALFELGLFAAIRSLSRT
jgi:sec-independent protein translocase protein TatC